MEILFLTIFYVMCAIFCGRFLLHALAWHGASRQLRMLLPSPRPVSFSLIALTALDVVLLRRLFASNKLLWLFSWTFHLSFFIVLIRHLRYILEPAPGVIAFIQPVGVVAGYTLTSSLVLLILYRAVQKKNRYAGKVNYLILGLVLICSASGLLMRGSLQLDLVEVKRFTLGLFSLRPEMLPGNPLLIVHLLSVLALIPLLPSHIFIAPAVMLEDERRRKDLEFIIHEK